MTPETYADRRDAAAARVSERAPEATGFLVTSLPNVRYLTGFTGSNAAVLLAVGERRAGAGATADVLGTDGRYALQASAECPGVIVHLDRSTAPALAARWAQADGHGDLAIEAEHVSVAGLRALARAAGREPVETTGVVEGLRTVKDPDELRLLQQACAISVDAWLAVRDRIRAGVTEIDIARRLEAEMMDRGAEGLSFPSIVAGGPHSAHPHHRPGSRPLQRGDLLVVDAGAALGGYHADMTRTVVVGAPADWHREVHALVLDAQEAARASVRPGAPLADIDAAARGPIAAAGHGAHFGHGLGHGVGLEVHEAPFIGAASMGMLAAGSTVTIEPGVYLADRGGVRVEDVVIAGGSVGVPTECERGLVEVG